MANTAAGGSKRKITDIIVDPDALHDAIDDSKKPKIAFDTTRKHSCLASIVEMYFWMINKAFETSEQVDVDTDKDPRNHEPTARVHEATNNITVGNRIICNISTLHYVQRQAMETGIFMENKSKESSYKIVYKGAHYPFVTIEIESKWIEILKNNKLEYQTFEKNPEDDWYGTMGTYLLIFTSFAYRYNEVRLGHDNMPIVKADNGYETVPVQKYGLTEAHHILLEGVSFPPGRRLSIAQYLGPMTAWLCMIRNFGKDHKKYATVVKKAMSHVPCINEMIAITGTHETDKKVRQMTTLVAEFLLINTARQVPRMFFPITIFAYVWKQHAVPTTFSNFFSTTGAGGWYTYKIAAESNVSWTISGNMETELASQIVFHSVFSGTFKEDLTVLEQITDCKKWYTRKELGPCFLQQGSVANVSRVLLPKMTYYAEMCANQTGLQSSNQSGVNYQVTTVPCFSGRRQHFFGEEFFEHMQNTHSTACRKTVSEIISFLISTIERLHERLGNNKGQIAMRTLTWREMASLTLGNHGNETDLVITGKSKMFIGKAKLV